MNTHISRSRHGSGSAAGAVIAGAVIVALTMIFCVLLLLFFWHPCCCCCSRAPEKTAAVASTSTFFGSNPHIGGTSGLSSRTWVPRRVASPASTVVPVAPPEPAHKAFSPEPLATSAPAPAPYYTGTHGGFLPPIGFGPMPSPPWGGPSSSSSAPASNSTVLPPVVSVPEPSSLAVMLGGLTFGAALLAIRKRSA